MGKFSIITCFKVNNRNITKTLEISSKFNLKTPQRPHYRRSAVFIVNFEHISNLLLVHILLTLNRRLFAGMSGTLYKMGCKT